MSPLIPLIVQGAKSWLGYKKAKAQAVQELELEEIRQGIRGGDHWVKRLSFCITFAPLIWGVFDIDGVKAYFTALNDAMPDYYIQMVLLINGSIWGGSTLNNIFRRLKR